MPGAGAPGIRLAFGGMLLIANFTPDSHGRGYMEAFMDWQLIYRDESQLYSLAAEGPDHMTCPAFGKIFLPTLSMNRC